MNIVYKPQIIVNLTGDTFSFSNIIFTDNINIYSGFTLNIKEFDSNTINRLDIIDNIINYIEDGINKYTLNLLIVSNDQTYENITEIGDYCLKIHLNDNFEYLIMRIVDNEDELLYNNILNSENQDIIDDIKNYNIPPIIYYNNHTNDSYWEGSGTTIPKNVYLHFFHDNISGWTLDNLKELFIDYVIDCNNNLILFDKINIKLYSGGIILDSISNYGYYEIRINVYDNFGNSVENIISDILVSDISPIVVYYNVLDGDITGNTSMFSSSTILIEPDIYIDSGFTFNLNEFNDNGFNYLDIINNVIDYVYGYYNINKYMLNILIVNNYNIIENVIEIGTYCVKIYFNDNIGNNINNYFILNVVSDDSNNDIVYYSNSNIYEINNISEDVDENIILLYSQPIIYYNTGETWLGGNNIIPHNVKLSLVHDGLTGWTINNLKNLFIDYANECWNGNIDLNDLIFKLNRTGEFIILNEITENGYYDIDITYTDISGNSINNKIVNILIDSSNPVIVYKSNILDGDITGNTSMFSSSTILIEPDIYINSGFTFNLNGFENNSFNSFDIISNVIDYVYGYYNINKYMLNILIVDNIGIVDLIDNIGEYCIKIYYYDEIGNSIIDYFIINVVFDYSNNDGVYYLNNNIIYSINNNDLDIEVLYNQPIIYYNTGETWLGGDNIIPHDVKLNLIHDGITGWTLYDLKNLFINHATECWNGEINIDGLSVKLYKSGELIEIYELTENGYYDMEISYTDVSDNSVINRISNILVDGEEPIIVYYPYIISSNITGNTSMFSASTPLIEPDIYISSGLTLNLGGFDNNIIDRMDIIDNIIDYVIDIDISVNKYNSDILVVNQIDLKIYDIINNPGYYCLKISLKDSLNNENIKYFMLHVIYDVSVYSEGYWQDNKVWVDMVHWLDHQIIPER